MDFIAGDFGQSNGLFFSTPVRMTIVVPNGETKPGSMGFVAIYDQAPSKCFDLIPRLWSELASILLDYRTILFSDFLPGLKQHPLGIAS
jgi:hypothetical protein